MKIEEFERLAKRTRLSATGREACRRVLVQGERQSDVARDLGVHRQIVYQAIQSLLRRRRHFNGRKIPHDWITITVSVPPELAAQIRELARVAQEQREDRRPGRPPKKPKERPQETRSAPVAVDAAADAARRLLGGLSLPKPAG
jgi:transposase-like protein